MSPALFDAYFDLSLLSLVFAVVSIDSFWSATTSPFWIAYFIVASIFLVAGIFVMYKNLNKVGLYRTSLPVWTSLPVRKSESPEYFQNPDGPDSGRFPSRTSDFSQIWKWVLPEVTSGLDITSDREVRKSGIFSKSSRSGFRTFSFQDAGLFTNLKVGSTGSHFRSESPKYFQNPDGPDSGRFPSRTPEFSQI